MAKPLDGVTVLVTRPAHQAEHLCQLIATQGGTARRFPLLAITEPRDPEALRAITRRLAEFDLVIFISPNAVEKGMQVIQEQGGLPVRIKVAAVGQGSARRLAELGVNTDIFPAQQFNSEALLAMEELQSVSGKRIVIYRGEGGRELLAQTLRERGATVEYAECYRREKPDVDPDALTNWLNRDELDILTVTSSESLRNMVELLNGPARSALLALPIIVVSERMQQLACELGFKTPAIIVKKAGDAAIVQAIIDGR
ncbi:MAG TPA: uroporphyrinogen-III synthase [Gammaproteobacteria bacterium]